MKFGSVDRRIVTGDLSVAMGTATTAHLADFGCRFFWVCPDNQAFCTGPPVRFRSKSKRHFKATSMRNQALEFWEVWKTLKNRSARICQIF